jgi:hypothetical protein
VLTAANQRGTGGSTSGPPGLESTAATTSGMVLKTMCTSIEGTREPLT